LLKTVSSSCKCTWWDVDNTSSENWIKKTATEAVSFLVRRPNYFFGSVSVFFSALAPSLQQALPSAAPSFEQHALLSLVQALPSLQQALASLEQAAPVAEVFPSALAEPFEQQALSLEQEALSLVHSVFAFDSVFVSVDCALATTPKNATSAIMAKIFFIVVFCVLSKFRRQDKPEFRLTANVPKQFHINMLTENCRLIKNV
jgi:hypothetical protein